ncbi:hypothetical protein RIEPE_A0011 (plasmid) [Candidatus Riesia pediculicola USDA]|uniref:Uncharacterized protein n=1 Tax=Riesia pediculicola (strain USDA) TaxID=515618 RepID=D4G929_RIEPU|nr:hypothetical protein RIEPE_A0011 [Candidatus Riesia pediculicola USDA]ARC54506.1 hypothetical protein AOE56_00030 [Candidatus Riesia pediculicola]
MIYSSLLREKNDRRKIQIFFKKFVLKNFFRRFFKKFFNFFLKKDGKKFFSKKIPNFSQKIL